MTLEANGLAAAWHPQAVGTFEQMYAAYRPAVNSYLLGMGGEVVLTEELTQEVFVRAAANLLFFRGDSSV